MKVKSESEVAQSYPTLRDPMDCSLPGSSAHGLFQARVLEWGAIAFSMSPLQGGTTVFGFAWDTGFLPLLSFFLFLAAPRSLWDLSSLTGD